MSSLSLVQYAHLWYDQQIGHLIMVHEILVEEMGQGCDEVGGQTDLVVLDLLVFAHTARKNYDRSCIS